MADRDIPGNCNALLFLADDYGDNECTLRCMREPGHDGLHWEHFERNGAAVHIEWERDERPEAEDDLPAQCETCKHEFSDDDTCEQCCEYSLYDYDDEK